MFSNYNALAFSINYNMSAIYSKTLGYNFFPNYSFCFGLKFNKSEIQVIPKH